MEYISSTEHYGFLQKKRRQIISICEYADMSQNAGFLSAFHLESGGGGGVGW